MLRSDLHDRHSPGRVGLSKRFQHRPPPLKSRSGFTNTVKDLLGPSTSLNDAQIGPPRSALPWSRRSLEAFPASSTSAKIAVRFHKHGQRFAWPLHVLERCSDRTSTIGTPLVA